MLYMIKFSKFMINPVPDKQLTLLDTVKNKFAILNHFLCKTAAEQQS